MMGNFDLGHKIWWKWNYNIKTMHVFLTCWLGRVLLWEKKYVQNSLVVDVVYTYLKTLDKHTLYIHIKWR